MLKKKSDVPTVLLLTDIVRDAALQVRPVSDAVAEEYADHLAALPAVTVWDVEGRYLLADGWHRCRAHELAGVTEVRVIVMKGTIEQVRLFVAMCDVRVGVRRNRAAKRQAVLLVLGTGKGMEWSDRKIGEHCGVSHTFVAQMKARLNAGQPQDADEPAVAAKTVRPAVAVDGNVATQVAERASGKAAVSDNVAAAVAPGGNVATRSAESAVDRRGKVATAGGATATRERGRGGNVATDPDASSVEEDQQTVAGLDEQRDQDSADADADALGGLEGDALGGLEGDADLADAPLFGDADRGTVGDVVRQAEALLDACGDDEERREVLGQLLDAFTGMLAAFDEGDLSDESDQEFDAE